ncbi:hypothetical protein NDU88_004242 [Pleurodeles waltl]|uniref:Uncharacterized protein n=1 Tax=Pleurodeles waltl TaxID=8319 RepID=A0AAV7MUK9_PLEWA|nr:hypothetical protein NDU88_004242 [Pleurodeles waltl]
MCAPQISNPKERWKAAGAALRWRAVLELRRTRRGAVRIPIRRNSGSTSEVAWVKQVRLGVLIRSVSGAEGGMEARAARRTVGQSGGGHCDTPLRCFSGGYDVQGDGLNCERGLKAFPFKIWRP